ncbi:MAG: hypothetical protein KKC99_11150 [Proteobacteria bacterium]|nr:hypothetical protein [Pseudomonadota bacterium]
MPTVSELHARLDKYLACEEAILGGAQSYQINGRVVTKATLPGLQKLISELEMRIKAARGGMHGHAVFGG